MRINVPARRTASCATLLERVNADEQLKAWWHVANVNAVARLEINDHSWVHIQIVTNIALKLLRQLTKHGVEPAMVTDYGIERDDAEVVVVLGALLHCVGMAVHRDGHEDFSLFLAEPKLRELLDGHLRGARADGRSSREVLQAITSHRDYGKPLTLEAGIVRVADALDMAKGRSRIPFERGRVIDPLAVGGGDRGASRSATATERPMLIEIHMNNSSGIYQVDELAEGEAPGLGPRAARRGGRQHRHRGREAPGPDLPARNLSRYTGATRGAGSSNGRTPGSGPGSLGSNPSPAAMRRPWKQGLSCSLIGNRAIRVARPAARQRLRG